MALLSEDEKKRIAQAIQNAESRTAGELVVVTTKSSDDYAARRALISAALVVAIASEVFWQLPELSPWLVFLGQVPLGLGLYALFGTGALLRLVVPGRLLLERVDARARRALVETGVLRTRERSGVLIFLSEKERSVEILADEGIHARVDDGEWQRDVDDLVRAVRANRAADGVLALIERLGGILAEKFPAEGTPNELPDQVREV